MLMVLGLGTDMFKVFEELNFYSHFFPLSYLTIHDLQWEACLSCVAFQLHKHRPISRRVNTIQK